MDWSGCPLVERVPGRLSGQPAVVRSRVRADDLVANREEGADWLAENYSLPIGTVRAVLAFHARSEARDPHPI